MIVATGDFHLGSGKNLGPNRHEDILNSLDQVINYVLKKKPQRFIILGDIYDYPSPSSFLRGCIAQRIRKVTNEHIQVIMIPGNHDFANGTHALSEMNELKIDLTKLMIVDQCAERKQYKWDWLYLPHNHAIDSHSVSWESEILSFARKKDKKRKRIVFGHFPVVGSKLSASNIKYRSDESATIATLKKLNANLILLGDIHKPQKLFPNCYYVGSIDRINFGERREQKSFIHVTKDWEVKRIKIDNRPLIQFDVGSDKYKDVKGAIVKPIIECDESDINKFNTAQILEKFKANKVHFVMPFEWNITESKKKQGRKITQEINIEDYLRKYIKRNHKKKNVNRLVKLYATAKVKDS